MAGEDAPGAEPRYTTILERFRATRERIEHPKRTKRRLSELEDANSDSHPDGDTVEAVAEKHGLGPLPQPEVVRIKRHRSKLEWPVEPEIVDGSVTRPFSELGVSDTMTARLDELGFSEAFAVQTAIIPALIADSRRRRLNPRDPQRDTLVHAVTGSGKTLAYCVPIVDALRTRVVPRVRAVILLPTRPLVAQVWSTLLSLSRGLVTVGAQLKCVALRSDRSLAAEASLLDGADIVVATPGRLVDHIVLRPCLLRNLQWLVVDEADRLVGQSFQDWTAVLAEAVRSDLRPDPSIKIGPPQRLVFSATLPRDPGRLAALQIRHSPWLPRLYVLGGGAGDSEREFMLPEGLDERLIRVPGGPRLKPLALAAALLARGSGHVPRTLVFAGSNESAARLAALLRHIAKLTFAVDLSVEACAGEMSAGARRRALRNFSEGTTQVLVCTDLVARGIDVSGIALIVNYDLPVGTREYVHRVGRTARAGASGEALILTTGSAERKHFWKLQNDIQRTSEIKVENADISRDGPEYAAALSALEEEVTAKL